MLKKLTSLALVAGLGAGVAGCESHTGSGALLGTAAGAGLGAIIGNNSGGHTGEGALIGAGVGALRGALVGSEMDKQELRRANEAARYERGSRYYEERDDYSHGPPPPRYERSYGYERRYEPGGYYEYYRDDCSYPQREVYFEAEYYD